MVNEELQYLRTEYQRLLNLHSKHTHITITTIIVIWSGALICLNMGSSNLMENVFNSIFSCFIIVTIFFISNLALYEMAHRSDINSLAISRLAAYIAVFYEKLPSETNVGENFCWESAYFEIVHKDKSVGKGSSFDVYRRLFIVSTGLMILFICLLLFFVSKDKELTIGLPLFLVNAICFFYSVRWYRKLPKSRSLKSYCSARAKFLNDFIQYRHDMKGDTGGDFEKMLGFKMDSVKTEIKKQEKHEWKEIWLFRQLWIL